jgi:hypothetical protein
MSQQTEPSDMSLSVSIYPVKTLDLPVIWPCVSGFIEKALDETDGEFSLDDIYLSLVEQKRALWVVIDDAECIAAVTTRIEEYPSGLNIAVIDFAGGRNFKAWSMFTDYISPFYKEMGCDKLEIAGRLGWLRLHTDKGFKIRYYVMRKDL